MQMSFQHLRNKHLDMSIHFTGGKDIVHIIAWHHLEDIPLHSDMRLRQHSFAHKQS